MSIQLQLDVAPAAVRAFDTSRKGLEMGRNNSRATATATMTMTTVMQINMNANKQ